MRAAGQTIETLEARLFMHAGHVDAATSAVTAAPMAAALVQTLVGPSINLAVTATTPLNGATVASKTNNITVTFAAAIDPASLSVNSNFELRDSNNALVPSAISYNATTRVATLNPNATLPATNNYFYVRIRGGATGVKDSAGNYLPSDFTFSFSTGTPTFTETTVFSGLVQPTQVKFAPDGRVFVAEKSGLIKVFDNLTDTTPTIFADLRTAVHNFWDRGLLGLALDPQFPTRPYVYVLYSYDGDLNGNAPKFGAPGVDTDPGPNATTTGALISGRLSRLTASGNTMVAGSETVLIKDWQQQFPSHSIGALQFGPDGMLYASAGDGASFNYADYGQTGNPFADPTNEGGAIRSQDLRTPGDATTLDGSIIRIDPNTGLAPSTNPLYNTGTDANAKRIIAEGLRNPFRFTFRPGTNEIWAGDVGYNDWEEINRITSTVDSTVDNFGWPAYEGMGVQPGYKALNLPILNNLYAAGASAVVSPYFTYAHSAQVVAGSGEPTGGSSTSGVAFYTSGSYPTAFNNALFFADYSRKRIYVMYAGPNGLPDPNSRQIFKASPSGPAELTIGPNGDLFYVGMDDGTIKRFQFFSTNRPPTAVATADKYAGSAPLTVNFSAFASSDPDPGDTLSYAWDLDADGQFDDSTSATPSWTYTTSGNRTVQLRVTDSHAVSTITSVLISAGNTAPVTSINAPLATLTWAVGDTINFSGLSTDAQDGNLPASALTWQLNLLHDNLLDPASSHTHHLQDFVGISSGSFIAPDHEYPSRLELKLIATDSNGLTTTSSVILQPKTATLNFNSTPAGITIGVNDQTGVTPFSTTVILGSNVSISAPAPQTINGITYNFSGWSDGGAENHNVKAAAGASYSATFTAAATGGGDVTAGLVNRWKFDEASGAATADSVGGNNGTLTSGATRSIGKVGTGAITFDGIDDYVATASDLAATLGHTASLTAWIKTAQVGSNTYWMAPGITGVEQANNVLDTFWGWIDGSGRIGLQAGDGAAAKSTSPINDNQWHHVALTRDENTGTLQVFVDGTLNSTVAGWDGAFTTPFSGIGRIDDTGGTPAYFNGALDDVRIYNRVLADTEVTVIKNGGTTGNNLPPTVATAAAAVPATVTAASTTLNVLGTDDGGEASLKYSWSVMTKPAGSPDPTFSAFNSNSAKSVTATFAAAGSYKLRATILDAAGASVTSDVTVTVASTLTSITLTPLSAPLANNATQQFAAKAYDQFGNLLATQPAFTWAIDGGGVGGTISTSGLYTAPATGSGTATVRATASGKSGTATISVGTTSVDVTAGLVDWWRMDENAGTAAADAMGGNKGTLTNGPIWTAGKAGGGAINFDGTDDYVAVANNLSTTLGGSATLTAWIKTKQVGNANMWEAPGITGAEQASGTNDSFWGWIDDTGRIGVQVGNGLPSKSTGPINNGVWHHVAFTRNATTGKVETYVDGVLNTSVTTWTGNYTQSFKSLGRIEDTSGTPAYFKGALDEVRVYNRVLTPAEVQAVMNAGSTTAPAAAMALTTSGAPTNTISSTTTQQKTNDLLT